MLCVARPVVTILGTVHGYITVHVHVLKATAFPFINNKPNFRVPSLYVIRPMVTSLDTVHGIITVHVLMATAIFSSVIHKPSFPNYVTVS